MWVLAQVLSTDQFSGFCECQQGTDFVITRIVCCHQSGKPKFEKQHHAYLRNITPAGENMQFAKGSSCEVINAAV